jgi:serine/threonine protein kinase
VVRLHQDRSAFEDIDRSGGMRVEAGGKLWTHPWEDYARKLTCSMTPDVAAFADDGPARSSQGGPDDSAVTDSSRSGGSLQLVSSRDVEECLRLLDEIWPRANSTAADTPRQLGRFSILRELGRGGFGVVFLAQDPLLGRRVAVKVPRIEVLSESQAWRRFLREARTASRLDHPNLVPLLEAGTIGPVAYIVSAFVDGPTLEHCLKHARAGAPPGFGARLVAELAGAIEHMHERGIVHRDLKPANILMQAPVANGKMPNSQPWEGPGSADWLPRICDFGLAKLRELDGDETRSRCAAGSPPYMSP